MSLAARTAKGALWSGASQWGKQAVNLSTTIVLARLLPPEDFGKLAMCAVFTGIFIGVSDLGMGTALVQAEDPSPDEFTAAFWLSAALGGASFLAVLAIAPLVGSFYRLPALQRMLGWLAIALIPPSLSVVHLAKLTRNLDFRRIAFAEVLSALCGGGLGVGAAVSGMGVFSLVIQSVGMACCSMIVFWSVCPWRPSLRFKGFARPGLIRFGSRLAGFNVVNYVARNVDYLLIGKFLGPEQLGYYTLAYRLMLFPLQNISAVLGRAVVPAFSQRQHDDQKLRDAFIRLIRYVALVSFPVMCGIAVAAPEFITVIFGVSWSPAVPLVRILAFVGMAQSLGTNAGSLYIAKGRTDVMFRWGIIATLVITASIGWSVQWGIREVALAYAFANLLLFYPGLAVPYSLVGGSFSTIVRSLQPILIISVLSAVATMLVRWIQGMVFVLPDPAVLIYTAILLTALPLVLIRRFMGSTVREAVMLLRQASEGGA